MATCVVSGTLVDPSETALDAVAVSFRTQTPVLDGLPVVQPEEVSTRTAVDGTWSLTLAQGISGVLAIAVPVDSSGLINLYKFSLTIPATSTATFASLWDGSN